MNDEFEAIIENIYERDVRYREDAYIFVMEALAYTQKKYKCSKATNSINIIAIVVIFNFQLELRLLKLQ